jgi:hypothetical protein
MTIKLSELRAARATMSTPNGLYANDEGLVYLVDDGISYTVANVRSTTRAAGIVATHNAADALIEIAEAALALRGELEYLVGPLSERLRVALSKVQP